MMRKDKIGAAAVNIQLIAKIARGHGAAFDMPARPPWSPRTGPGRLARLLRLPEYKVERIIFERIVRVVAALVGCCQPGIIAHISSRLGQFAEMRIAFDAEIDVALAHIGVTARQQLLD